MQALGQAQQIDEMLQLLAGAWSGASPLRPSIYACNSAVGACARAGRLDEALRLCSAMVRSGGSLPRWGSSTADVNTSANAFRCYSRQGIRCRARG